MLSIISSFKTTKTKKNNTMMTIITTLLLLVIFILLPQTLALPKSKQSHFFKYKTTSKLDKAKSMCETTPFPSTCFETLIISSVSSENTLSGTKQSLYDHSVQFSIAKAGSARALAHNLTLMESPNKNSALDDCLELLDDTLDLLSNAAATTDGDNTEDVHTWLSAAMTNQDTCLESLETQRFVSKAKSSDDHMLELTARNLSHIISNSLSLFLSSELGSSGRTRKLLSFGNRFPTWTTRTERRLLMASIEELKPDAVVAKDGSGTHKTISEAIEFVSSMTKYSKAQESGGGGRTVIHITSGTYHEYIKIPTKQKNVMLVGDGKGKSVIVGDKNSGDGSTTYNSATVGAMGDGFIARDITFVNNAGPQKHQAVALRVGSDRSVVFKCSIEGYQDSLYTHSKRQFFRETDIYGTVDFIFGNSASVFQSCNIMARKPGSSGLNNFITAQGRSSPDQNTGISIHNCRIGAGSDLAPVKSKYDTYLGRPWKQYSRTVIMESVLDDSISSRGWYPWSGGFALNTLFYGEYKNAGPGAQISGRVGWAGVHTSLSAPQANSFTVGGFISGNSWLPSTGVSFDSGLVG